MNSKPSPTVRLLAGLAVTLSAVALYSGYTMAQLRSLRRLQEQTIDRNRRDSLLLLRIQNDLNALGLTMRDMLDATEPYPLSAWQGQLKRIRYDLEDALSREEQVAAAGSEQRRYLANSIAQFWDGADRIFGLAQTGEEEEARARVRLSLEARQATLAAAVARLLVQNNEGEQQAAAEAQAIYARVERNVYLFVTAMLLVVAATGLYLAQYNRRMFARVAALSERRSELAQQLISIQENTFRYISRELHDDFGQILTAIGAMLQRTLRRASAVDAPLTADLQEVRGIVQSTLEKVRTMSQSLHPVVLDDAGLEGALNLYLPALEKQTGISIHYRKEGESRPVDRNVAIHLYRVLQEALNNVVRHAKSPEASVSLRYSAESLVLEVEDRGVGFGNRGEGQGMGLVSMRERSELVNGRIEFLDAEGGGALVRVTVPLTPQEAHADA